MAIPLSIHRITWAGFRPGSTRRSRRQAGLCPCPLLHLIANQAEPTVAPLRYALGGYRPSKTDRLPGSPRPSKGARGLDCPALKGGVSSPAPPAPKGALHSLPLTLSINAGQPVTAYSKGA